MQDVEIDRMSIHLQGEAVLNIQRNLLGRDNPKFYNQIRIGFCGNWQVQCSFGLWSYPAISGMIVWSFATLPPCPPQRLPKVIE